LKKKGMKNSKKVGYDSSAMVLKLQKSRWDKIDLVVQHILGFFFGQQCFVIGKAY